MTRLCSINGRCVVASVKHIDCNVAQQKNVIGGANFWSVTKSDSIFRPESMHSQCLALKPSRHILVIYPTIHVLIWHGMQISIF